MAANKIQIKRSVSNGAVSGLSNGELAFTQASNTLWIGLPDGSGVVSIAGARNPGVLTANQALVTNSSSGIDKVIVANLNVQQIYANGSVGTAGYVLASGAAGNTYWINPSTLTTSAAGSNTQIQFNDSGSFGAVTGLTFDKTSNTIAVSNAVQTQYITAPNGARNITTNYGSIGGAVGISTDLTVGTSTVGGNISAPATATIKIGTTTINSTVYSGTANNADYLGGWGLANIETWISSNASSAYTNATSYADTVAGNAYSNATSYADTAAGTAYSNATSYADTAAGTAYSNATSYADTAAGTAYSNATSYADTAAGTAYSNATSYADTAAGNAYSNAMSDTLSRDGSYTGNNTFGGTNTVFNSNVVFGNGISSDLMPTSNTTYNVGNNTVRWNEIHASNVHSVSGYFDGDVQVGGNLLVSGNVTTVNVTSINVSDPLIYLAGNNYSSDLVDIGFAGNYYDGQNRHTGLIRHASTDEYYLFKNLTQELSGNNVVDINDSSFRLADLNAWILSGGLVSNSSHVQITANSSVEVSITANSITLSTPLAATSGGTGRNTYTSGDILVANTGNSLSVLGLGSAGYVLQSNGSALVYDTLDGGTF
jgi:hypothetical protein